MPFELIGNAVFFIFKVFAYPTYKYMAYVDENVDPLEVNDVTILGIVVIGLLIFFFNFTFWYVIISLIF